MMLVGEVVGQCGIGCVRQPCGSTGAGARAWPATQRAQAEWAVLSHPIRTAASPTRAFAVAVVAVVVVMGGTGLVE